MNGYRDWNGYRCRDWNRCRNGRIERSTYSGLTGAVMGGVGAVNGGFTVGLMGANGAPMEGSGENYNVGNGVKKNSLIFSKIRDITLIGSKMAIANNNTKKGTPRSSIVLFGIGMIAANKNKINAMVLIILSTTDNGNKTIKKIIRAICSTGPTST
jgi:hypothetical protein